MLFNVLFSFSFSVLVITCNGVLIVFSATPTPMLNSQMVFGLLFFFCSAECRSTQPFWHSECDAVKINGQIIIEYEDVWYIIASKFTACNLFILHVFSPSISIKFNGNVEIFGAVLCYA